AHGGPLNPLLARMLAADPAERPPMPEVAHTLQALQTDIASTAGPNLAPALASEPTAVLTGATPTSSYPVGVPAAAASRSERHWVGPALAALVVVAALVIAAVLLSRHQRSPGTAAQGGRSSTPTQSSWSPSIVRAVPIADASARAIAPYYAQLTDKTDEGWQVLTERY